MKSLSDYTKLKIGSGFITKFKNDYPALKHFDTDDIGYAWIDGNNIVAICAVDPKEKDGYKFITIIEVMKKYQRQGLGKDLVRFCVDELSANALTVRKTNSVAIHLYKSCGFKILKSNDSQHTMVFDGLAKEEVEIYEECLTSLFEEKESLNYKSYKFDSWGKSPSTNTLYITGLSGSGKSTLAQKFKDKDTYVIHLDSYFDNPDGPKDSAFGKYLQAHFPDYIKMSLPKDQIDMREWIKVVDRFSLELEKWSAQCFKEGKKVIVDGVQILDDTMYPEKKFFAGKPVIIMKTGILTSIHRGNKRDGAKFSLSNISDAMSWKKDIKNFKKGMKNA